MNTARATRAGAAVVALILSACNDDDGGGGKGPGPGLNVECEDQPGAMRAAAAPPRAGRGTADLDLAGTWAARADLSVGLEGRPQSALSVCPEKQTGTVSLLFYLRAQQNQKDLQDVEVTVCDLRLPPVTTVAGECKPGTTPVVTTRMVLPDTLREALPGLRVEAVSGSLSEMKAGADVSFERLLLTAGSSKTSDELPSWNLDGQGCSVVGVGFSNECAASCVDDCGALRDDDEDTFPGVTLGLCGRTEEEKGKECNIEEPGTAGAILQGRLFTALRLDPEIKATAESSCEMNGTVDAEIGLSVIGADVTFQGARVPVAMVIRSLPAMDVDAEKSKVTLTRVDGRYGTKDLKLDPKDAAASCEALREANLPKIPVMKLPAPGSK